MSNFIGPKTIGTLLVVALGGLGTYTMTPSSPPEPSTVERPVYQPRPADQRQWGGMSKEELTALRDGVKQLAPQKVSIYCGGNYCRDLAEDLDEALESAGIDSYIEFPLFDLGKGTGAGPNSEQVRTLVDAIKSATGGRVDLPAMDPPPGPNGKPVDYNGSIVIALGRKPAAQK